MRRGPSGALGGLLGALWWPFPAFAQSQGPDGDVAIAMHLTDSKWTFPSVIKLGVLGVLLEDLVIDLIVMIVTS